MPRGPETITFDTPIYSASIRVGQTAGGTVRLTAFDGTTPVSTNFQTSQSDLQTLDVAAARITSLRLEFSGTATVWDDLTWSTSPVSANDAFGTPANTALNVGAPGVLGNDRDPDGDPHHRGAAARAGQRHRRPARRRQLHLHAARGLLRRRFVRLPRERRHRQRQRRHREHHRRRPASAAAADAADASTASIGSLAFPKFTKLTSLAVNELPAGSKVVVTCKTKKKKQQKKGCAYKSKRFTDRRARRRAQPAQAVQEEEAPGRHQDHHHDHRHRASSARRFTYTMRKRKLPEVERAVPQRQRPRRQLRLT